MRSRIFISEKAGGVSKSLVNFHSNSECSSDMGNNLQRDERQAKSALNVSAKDRGYNNLYEPRGGRRGEVCGASCIGDGLMEENGDCEEVGVIGDGVMKSCVA